MDVIMMYMMKWRQAIKGQLDLERLHHCLLRLLLRLCLNLKGGLLEDLLQAWLRLDHQLLLVRQLLLQDQLLGSYLCSCCGCLLQLLWLLLQLALLLGLLLNHQLRRLCLLHLVNLLDWVTGAAFGMLVVVMGAGMVLEHGGSEVEVEEVTREVDEGWIRTWSVVTGSMTLAAGCGAPAT
nr:hypothetical protein BaRGS_013800 [Batillaria attramentaria]